MDGNEGCCIAGWTDGPGYDMSTMDKIMLRYRPIAPKPATVNPSEGATSEGSSILPRDGRHAKAAVRGRKKSAYSNSNSNSNSSSSSSGKRCNNNNRRKRKSCSPPDRRMNGCMDTISQANYGEEVQKGGVALLPLFPEEPDLSPTDPTTKMPIWLNYLRY